MKIIATLGPSTSNKKVIGELINSGADTLRLNFSHFYEKQFQEMLSIARNIDENIKFEKEKAMIIELKVISFVIAFYINL